MEKLRIIQNSRQVLSFADSVFQRVQLFDYHDQGPGLQVPDHDKGPSTSELPPWQGAEVAVGAPCGGPVVTLSDKVQFRTPAGDFISSLEEWDKGLVAAIGWTHLHDAVFILVNGNVGIVK